MDVLVIPSSVRGIKTTKRLSKLLHIPESKLIDVAMSASTYYAPYLKSKPNGKKRKIHNPQRDLMYIQDTIYKRMLKPVQSSFPFQMTGAISGRSIRQNAAIHRGSSAALAFDLKNCYGSISDGDIHNMWFTYFDCSPDIATLLMKLTAVDKGLPQGAPTSPTIANIILFPMTVDILEISDKYGFKFSMFLDDGTVSGDRESITSHTGEILESVVRHGYALSRGKTHILVPGRDRMLTTSLDFTGTPQPHRDYSIELRNLVLTELRAGLELSPRTLGKIAHLRSFDKQKAKKIDDLIEATRLSDISE